ARPLRVGDVDAIEEPPRLLVLGVELRRALEVESGLLVAERVEARARRAHVARGERPVLVAEELLLARELLEPRVLGVRRLDAARRRLLAREGGGRLLRARSALGARASGDEDDEDETGESAQRTSHFEREPGRGPALRE